MTMQPAACGRVEGGRVTGDGAVSLLRFNKVDAGPLSRTPLELN